MAVQNTSSAYDLSMYEALPKPRKQPQLKVVEKRSAKRTLSAAFTPKALGSFSIVVTLICLMVYNQVCLNEVSGEIYELQQQLTELSSENTKITSQLESLISLPTVAQRAEEELGMARLDKYQTEYVNLYGEDKINLSQDSPSSGLGDGARLVVRSFIGRIVEYIG